MFTHRSLLIALIVVLANSVSLADDMTLKMADIEGTWQPIKGQLGGEEVSPTTLQAIFLKIKDGGYEVTINGEVDLGDLKLDASTDPARLDMTGLKGPSKDLKIKAIAKLDDKKLIIAYDVAAALQGKGDYPKDFTSTRENGVLLMTYQLRGK